MLIGLIANIVEQNYNLNYTIIMATKCPYCGSPDVQCLNTGKRILAGIASGTTYALLSPFMRGDAKYPAKNVHESICKTKKYICLNDRCRKKFEIHVF